MIRVAPLWPPLIAYAPEVCRWKIAVVLYSFQYDHSTYRPIWRHSCKKHADLLRGPPNDEFKWQWRHCGLAHLYETWRSSQMQAFQVSITGIICCLQSLTALYHINDIVDTNLYNYLSAQQS